jgi:hypothetical protein
VRTASGRVVLLFFGACCPPLFSQQKITSTDAKPHVGEQATVCGDVSGIHYASRTKGEPTFINLDKPYPNQVFTILIWGSESGEVRQSGGSVYRKAIVCLRTDHCLSRRAGDRCA